MKSFLNRIKNKIKKIGAAVGIRRVSKVSIGLLVLNFIAQRIFGINKDCKWSVHFTSKVLCPEKIQVHESSKFVFSASPCCYIQAINGIIIGKNTLWAPGVGLISANHDQNDFSKHTQDPPIVIGDNCWIGMNVVILPGVVLGNNTIVGAGSVVTKSFSEGNCTIVGNPAKVLKKR